MLEQKHITIIKSLIPLLEQTGAALTDHFYNRMFKHNPELKHVFNMSHQASGTQKAALFEAIAAYAKNIESVEILQSAVERIAQKHTSFNVQPEMYDIVGHHLTETLRELTGELFTAEVEEAWTCAYQFLASIFIKREGDLYQQRVSTKGGWQGTRQFTVKAKINESELVTSFVFEPADGQPVIDFNVGQYLGVEVNPVDHPYTEIRQYSLSDKPNGKTYRISVKREAQGVPGVVSNYLHDQLNVGDSINLHAPAGDFFFTDKQTPIVLISAGVGVTPMQAMLAKLAEDEYQHDVYYLHACQNKAQHSFKQATLSLTEKHNWQTHTWYQEEVNSEAQTYQGKMNIADIALPFGNANFYLCGPVGFMQFAKTQLLEHGVANERIHYEVFGPHAHF
ncbi:NO-inducible flavohemoprotein [Catenovulum sp. SM1970]|uniref:NO-inducible flavohemoprotein n=1 Tax=Marinifaba aquimaris TaxID=2741323 RepID=UPI0015731C76|nr:NO-inducible flavohemoprotein [Marinifaba aquimaris]NTS76763.1 NO-inducible flavohemoprotein [Marinifaba aquimaris]